MDEEIVNFLQLFGFSGSGITATVTVLALFWKADEFFSNEMIEALSTKLTDLKLSKKKLDWTEYFSGIFDRIFTKDHLSLRCFLFSCLFSILFLFIITLLMIATTELRAVFIELLRVANKSGAMFAISWIFFTNIFADYLSLLETRIILKYLKNPNIIGTAVLLTIDFLMTTIIYFLMYFASYCILFIVVFSIGNDLLNSQFPIIISGLLEIAPKLFQSFIGLISMALLFETFSFHNEEALLLISIYTTYFTSIWIWLFLASWVLTALITRLSNVLRILQWALPIRTKPLRALGVVSASLVALVYLAMGAPSFVASIFTG